MICLLLSLLLVTNFSKFYWLQAKVLALYRKRGSAEAHIVEVKSAPLLDELRRLDRPGCAGPQRRSLLLSLYAY